MPSTYTSTKTFQRLDLIILQFRKALRHATNISIDTLARLELGITNNWIQDIKVYALDTQDLCRAQIVLSIDWNEYNRQISLGKATVAIDDTWQDDTAIEIDEAIRLFKKYVQAYTLNTIWHVVYTSWVNADPLLKSEVQKTLGLVSAVEPKWARQPQGTNSTVPELSEFSIGLFLTFDN